MQTISLSREKVVRRAKHFYESSIRPKNELEENIGNMVIIDIETSDYYKVDENSLHAADYLSAKHPHVRLFGIRIGYNIAGTLGGVMEPVPK